MEKLKKEDVIQELFELNNPELAMPLLNFQSDMEGIKNDMVDVLNLLDEISENSNKKRRLQLQKLIRTKILDSYNSLPRKTNSLIHEIITILKEE